jgi:hypothetical protein
MRFVVIALATLPSFALATGAQAQSIVPSLEVATDENRRGLSWSDGRATASADLAIERGAVRGSMRVSALRGSALHDGADAAIDLALGTSHDVGPVELTIRGSAHLFSGAASEQDFGEIGASAAYTIGPLRVNAGGDYAPDQSAIGGDNLYLFAGADAGIPATPWTIFGHVGRSSGDADADQPGSRLRPKGNYKDWRIGGDYVAGPLVLSIEYVGTDIPRERVHDDRAVVRARFSF